MDHKSFARQPPWAREPRRSAWSPEPTRAGQPKLGAEESGRAASNQRLLGGLGLDGRSAHRTVSRADSLPLSISGSPQLCYLKSG